MGELNPIRVRYNGLFDFDGLYASIIEWAKSYNYMWHEKQFKHKVNSGGAELEMIWYVEKRVDEFIQYKITMNVHVWDLHEVEVDISGKKKKLSNARIQIIMKGEVVGDVNKFGKEKGRLNKIFSKLYKEQVNPEEDHEGILHYRINNLQGVMKDYFDMQTKKNVYKGILGEN
jgi:hypothetical protein